MSTLPGSRPGVTGGYVLQYLVGAVIVVGGLIASSVWWLSRSPRRHQHRRAY